MFKELVHTMGFLYTYASRGRGKLSEGQLRGIEETGATLTVNAEAVLGGKDQLSSDEKTDLEQAVMMEQHIMEVVQFILAQEII